MITCSPSWAYGAAGNPPFVPPNSYVVFNVEVIKIENDDSSSSSTVGADEGAQLLLGSGIGVRNKKTITATSGGGGSGGKRGSRIILVNNLNNPEATTATA